MRCGRKEKGGEKTCVFEGEENDKSLEAKTITLKNMFKGVEEGYGRNLVNRTG